MYNSMKSFLKKKIYTTYIDSSPWLLAAAAAILVFIVATFALYNYRLEKRVMQTNLEQRAATLVRVLHANLRMALVNELRQHQQLSSGWPEQLQQIVTHVSDDTDILFLSLADNKGTILAHSDPHKVGTQAPAVPLQQTGQEGRNCDGSISPHRITFSLGTDQAFTACTYLVIQPQGRGMNRMLSRMNDGPMMRRGPGSFEHRSPMMGRGRALPSAVVNQEYLVAVGLNIHEHEQALARMQWQILLLSLAMLLVGLGGWLSLAAVQGYRVSQKTVEKVQAYTALLVAQLPLGVIATAPDGRIETWNGATAVLTGLSAAAALDKFPQEVLPAVLAAFFDESEVEEGSLAAKSLTLTLAGERKVLLCQPLKITDAVQTYRGRVLLLSDITELTDLEQKMRENERLAAIGRIAGGVAHEVRNPLSSIKGLAYYLKNHFSEGSREQESAALLIQETERLNRTITEMLGLTHPTQLKLEEVDMVELLRQSLTLMQAELEERNIKVQWHCDPALPSIQGDADRLRQVLMNVLLNAQQAMDSGGTLTVKASTSADRLWLGIQVVDTGRGITPELLSQVFYPYFTTRESGTGIGLAISRKIIIEHQGSIEIQSEPGKGTLVEIRLPVDAEAAPINTGDEQGHSAQML